MVLKSRVKNVIALFIILSCTMTVEAQRTGPQRSDRGVNQRSGIDNSRYLENHGRYRTQPIHRNPHFRYPRTRRVLKTLPRGYRPIFYGGIHFYVHLGTYYMSCAEGYSVVLPPVGFRITVLPVGYTRIIIGPRLYFHYGGVYYIKVENNTSEEEFEVVDSPVGAKFNQLPENAKSVVIDGKNYYEHNGVIYKKSYLEQDNKSYEIVHITQQEN